MKKTLGIHTAPARQWVGNGFPLHSLFSYGTSALADVLDADRELLVGQDDSAGTPAAAAPAGTGSRGSGACRNRPWSVAAENLSSCQPAVSTMTRMNRTRSRER